MEFVPTFEELLLVAENHDFESLTRNFGKGGRVCIGSPSAYGAFQNGSHENGRFVAEFFPKYKKLFILE